MTDAPPGAKLRFIDAMPRPLLIAFVAFAIVALAASVYAIVRPPLGEIALQERRPPPRAPYSHDVGRLVPGPIPASIPVLPPACDAVRGARLLAGGDGVVRLRAVLARLCPLASGAGNDVARAVRALSGATIRFAEFGRTGVESTVAHGTIWLNIKFGLRSKPVEQIAPIVLHEAWHLANARAPVTAEQELRARAVESAACRQLVTIKKWPRWCRDAAALTDMTPIRAIALLLSAGYSEQ